jgi:ferritin
MLGKKVEDALNAQMNREFYSSYLYLSMSAHFESNNLKGFAHWLRIQADEELAHAMKFYGYMVQRGARPALRQIDAPTSKWKTHTAVFEDAYKHEQKVTKFISELVDLAQAEVDHATEVFLQWFVNEQVEEEMNASEIENKMKLAGDSTGALFVLDSELGKRPSK